jgi:hypothetical protein
MLCRCLLDVTGIIASSLVNNALTVSLPSNEWKIVQLHQLKLETIKQSFKCLQLRIAHLLVNNNILAVLAAGSIKFVELFLKVNFTR